MAKRRTKQTLKQPMAKLLDVRLVKEYLPITMSIVTLGVVIWLLN